MRKTLAIALSLLGIVGGCWLWRVRELSSSWAPPPQTPIVVPARPPVSDRFGDRNSVVMERIQLERRAKDTLLTK